jgi:acyl-CoA synthetase (AMP-forming)/AMP-acid ligase II
LKPAHCAPPPITFEGKVWSSDELTALALAWRDALDDEAATSTRPTAVVMANHPEAVALFFALSSGRAPLILLPPEPRSWHTSPSIPAGTRLVLPPALGRLAPEAERLGLRVSVLPELEVSSRAPTLAFMTCPGFVFFTSGSTDLPRPVYRTTAHLLEAASTVALAAGFPPDGGVIAALPLDRVFGMHHGLLAATLLERPLALLERFNHNTVLALFASGEYHLWIGTPVMADILARSPLAGSHRAPARCIIAGRLSASLCRNFEARFGVRLRQVYGITETGPVTVDAAPASDVRSATAGRPFPGVRVCIGDDPRAPFPPGQPGRIWISTPWRMEGYGFPPDVEPPASTDGWWPAPDVGRLDEAGYLTVEGRLDDCVRTAAGHVVNPAAIAAAVEAYPAVIEAAVVPLDTATGRVMGVLVESAVTLSVGALREHLARSLPPWSRPRVIETTRALPRLSSGRLDRRACIAILGTGLDPAGSSSPAPR